MVKDNLTRIRHMLDAANAISSFIEKTDPYKFKDDLLVLSALLRQLEVFGEAASRISIDFRERHTAIPWHKILAKK